MVIADLDASAAGAAARELGERAMGVGIDVRDRLSTQDAFDQALARFGRVDVVHANAGVSNMRKAIDLTEDDWDFNLNVNAKGVRA